MTKVAYVSGLFGNTNSRSRYLLCVNAPAPETRDNWQDGYDLGLEHGEKLAGQTASVWSWVLLGIGVVLALEVLIAAGVFFGIVAYGAELGIAVSEAA